MTTPFELYRHIQAVNFSTLKAMELSPLRYQHVLQQPHKDTDSMRCGRLEHCGVFQPDVAELWPEWQGGNRTANALAAFLAENGEDYIWKRSELDAARNLRKAVERNAAAMALLIEGKAEQAHTWVDALTGIHCKGRTDWIDATSIVELKTTKNALSKRMIVKQILAYHYHAQAAFYLDGTGRDRFSWIFAEQDAPHDVVVVPATPEWIDAGRALYQKWLVRLAECRATNTWPGLGEKMEVEVPTYAMLGADDPGLDLSGLEAE